MPVECISDDDINYNNNDADDSNVHQIEYGNLKLKRDNSVYSPTLYKSLRKVTQEPILSLVPPLVPSEKLQFDKSMIYETTKKRYHTSPHNKHRVRIIYFLIFFSFFNFLKFGSIKKKFCIFRRYLRQFLGIYHQPQECLINVKKEILYHYLDIFLRSAVNLDLVI